LSETTVGFDYFKQRCEILDAEPVMIQTLDVQAFMEGLFSGLVNSTGL